MLKVKPCIIGLPGDMIVISAVISFAVSYYVYPALLGYLCISLVACYLYRKHLLKDYISLKYDMGGQIQQEILVRGIPETFLEEVDDLIESNKLLIIGCPKNWALRKAISDRVYNKAGFVEFQLSDELSIDHKELGKRAVLLSYRAKKTLQDAISHLMNRGWNISGEQGIESNLIDRVYTQRMVYEPAES